MTARVLSGCEVLPPMDTAGSGQGRRARAVAKSAGRFQALNAFVDFTLRHLSRAEAAVWLVLFRDSRGGVAQTSQGDIAARIGSTPRRVRRAVVRLEALGRVVVVRRGRLGEGPSRYRVLPLTRAGP